MTKNNLKIEYVPIDSLHHVEYNPRIINDSTKAAVRKSIEIHGMQDPLIVNNAPERMGGIIGGNLRYEVLKDLGYTEVPVVFVTIPDNIACSKICDNGQTSCLHYGVRTS